MGGFTYERGTRRSSDDDQVLSRQADGREAGADPGGGTPSSAALLQRKIQRRLARRQAAESAEVAPDAREALAGAAGSSGQPLPEPLQRKFEGSLGVDLGGVRVHTGEESGQAAESISAMAYTTGEDIHFARGQYDPSSSEGQKLLAHEVAHTVQQSNGQATGATQTRLEVSEPGDALEHDADRAADAMVDGRSATVAGGGDGGVQRFKVPGVVKNVVDQAGDAAQQAGQQAQNVVQGAGQGPGVVALAALFARGQPDPKAVADLLHQFPSERDAILDYCRQHGGNALVDAVKDAEANAGGKGPVGPGQGGPIDVTRTPMAGGPVPIPYLNVSGLGGIGAQLGNHAKHGADAAQEHAHDGATAIGNTLKGAGKKLKREADTASVGTPEPGTRQYDIRGGVITVVGPPAIAVGSLATRPGTPVIKQEGDATVTTCVEAVVPGSCQTSHGGVVLSGNVHRTERRGPHGVETVVEFVGVYFSDPMVVGTVPCVGGLLTDVRGKGLVVITVEPA